LTAPFSSNQLHVHQYLRYFLLNFTATPAALTRIVDSYMSFVECVFPWRACIRGLFAIFLSVSAQVAICQTATPAAPSSNQPAAPALAPKPSDLLHPALTQVSQAIAGLNIGRWRAPNEVRSATQQNTDSIQHDLDSTLPGLLAQADATPNLVSATFPVYRNIDALYDVLLRVSQTANLAAPDNEATNLLAALNQLESARAQLGDAIVSNSKDTETRLVTLQTAVQKAAATPPPQPKTVVVDNGPATTTTTHRKKKPAQPANSSQPQQQQQPSQQPH
jgi:hypothetical protein